MQPTIPTPSELREILLRAHGIQPDDAERFLEPPYEIGDVFAFQDMHRAVDRIHRALADDEHIGIYADYDCDGIPGAVIMVDFFEKLGVGDRVHVYIPDRHDEGYGLSVQGIEVLAQKGVTLILTIDLGITGCAEVADAQSRGIDVIITDHHAPIGSDDPQFPAAYAIIHPAKSTYRNGDPCGAAVAFYLVYGFLHSYRQVYGVPPGWEKWLLDMVGFATLSDMVSLTGENRMLAAYGLVVARKTPRVGLRTLLMRNSVSVSTLTEQDLTFTVAPRLNAASRMASPILAFDLLRAGTDRDASALVGTLESINADRKLLVARIVKEAHGSLTRRELPDIVVIGNPNWRPAVLGLVATKLCETYGRSFFVWGNGGDGSIKGSCRMIESHHAASLMQALPEGVLLHAGGHKAAGGFTVAKEHVHFLEEALNACLVQRVDDQEDTRESTSIPVIALPLATVTDRHLRTVRLFGPFGVGNPQPIFRFCDVTITQVKMFGKAKEHLELVVRDASGTATAFMFFAPKTVCQRCIEGACVSLTGTLEAGFRGGARIRMQEVA